jgi:hypothetical protein
MPADLNSLTEGWLELESDPGKNGIENLVIQRFITLSPVCMHRFRSIYIAARGLWRERSASGRDL